MVKVLEYVATATGVISGTVGAMAVITSAKLSENPMTADFAAAHTAVKESVANNMVLQLTKDKSLGDDAALTLSEKVRKHNLERFKAMITEKPEVQMAPEPEVVSA